MLHNHHITQYSHHGHQVLDTTVDRYVYISYLVHVWVHKANVVTMFLVNSELSKHEGSKMYGTSAGLCYNHVYRWKGPRKYVDSASVGGYNVDITHGHSNITRDFGLHGHKVHGFHMFVYYYIVHWLLEMRTWALTREWALARDTMVLTVWLLVTDTNVKLCST